ncbi:hypothetical protein DRQ53_08060 [bacterium]|nr:MAG: hypothetical protein DRQ53_08060 [bacterium]
MRKLLREASLFGMLLSARWSIFKACYLRSLTRTELKAVLAGVTLALLMVLLNGLSACSPG